MLAVQPASTKQIAYIERLRAETGETDLDISSETTSTEASKIIQRLIAKQNGDINEPRLGMAMKECFRYFLGRDIWDKNRNLFMETTIKTYDLFTEIHERLNRKE